MIKNDRFIQALMIGAAISSLCTGNATAQETAETAMENLGWDEVIVTAQKRAQNALDVGIAMAVVGEQEIKARRIETPSDLVVFTPNATVKETLPGLSPIITIRGVGLNDFNAQNNPATGVYVDEVSLSSLALLSSDLFDLERMEVLKGPQGTLYGRNSTAGALNIISAKPNFNGLSGRMQVGLGSYKSRDMEIVANIPLSESFALRLSGKGIIQDKGFYFDETRGRDVGRREVLAGRAQALWRPSDTLDILLKLEGQQARSELGSPEFFGVLPTATETNCPGSTGCSDFFGYTDTDGDPFRGSWSIDPDYNLDQVGATARIKADLGSVTLTSVSGYINFSRNYGADTDAGPRRLTDVLSFDDVHQISQELRLSGSSDMLDWQAGVYYSKDDVTTIFSGELQDLANTTTHSSADQVSESKAIFGNTEWSLNDSLSIVTGLRYSVEDRATVNLTQDNVSEPGFSGFTRAPFGAGPIVLAFIDDELRENSWSWKVGTNWKARDNMLVYASASQGTKSGGFFAGVATNQAQYLPYESETLISYEVGIKGRLAEQGVTYDASAFYYDYSDVQTRVRDTTTVSALPISRIGNVSEAELYGAELDLTFRPASLEGLVLNLGGGLLSAELGSFESAAGTVPKGNKMPDAPKLTVNLGAAYTTDISNRLALRFSVDGRYQSETFRDALNDPLLFTDGYWVANGRISLLEEGNWDLSIWGKNLGEKQYVTQGSTQLGFGYGFRVYGSPRTYGVSLAKSF